MTPTTCTFCLARFLATRSDAKFCSGACRQAATRARQAAKRGGKNRKGRLVRHRTTYSKRRMGDITAAEKHGAAFRVLTAPDLTGKGKKG